MKNLLLKITIGHMLIDSIFLPHKNIFIRKLFHTAMEHFHQIIWFHKNIPLDFLFIECLNENELRMVCNFSARPILPLIFNLPPINAAVGFNVPSTICLKSSVLTINVHAASSSAPFTARAPSLSMMI